MNNLLLVKTVKNRFSSVHDAKVRIFTQSGYHVCFVSFRFCKNSHFSYSGRGRYQFFLSMSNARSDASASPLRRDTGSAR